jgi:hypothetical protein
VTHYLGTNFVVGPRSELPDAGNPLGAVHQPSKHIYLAWDTGEVLISNGHTWTTMLLRSLIANGTSVPVLAMAAGAGTTPPAAVLGTSNDQAGLITFGTGTSPAAGDQVTVTFGTAYAAAPNTIILTPANSATAAKAPLYVASITASGFTVGLANAPAASQANTVYAFSYLVVQ